MKTFLVLVGMELSRRRTLEETTMHYRHIYRENDAMLWLDDDHSL